MPSFTHDCKQIIENWAEILTAHHLIDRFAENLQAVAQRLFGDGQRWRDFYGLAPGADGRKEQEAFVETFFNDRMGQIVVGLFLSSV